MNNRTRLAMGLAGGYLLGRYRKTRMLGAIVAMVAAKRLGDAAVKKGTAALGSPAELDKLAGAGREAAVAVLSGRINGLTRRIHDRTESMRHPGGDQSPPEAESPSEDESQPEARPQPEAQSQPGAQSEPESQSQPEAQSRPGGSGASGQQRPNGNRSNGGQRGSERSRRTQVSGRPGANPRRG